MIVRVYLSPFKGASARPIIIILYFFIEFLLFLHYKECIRAKGRVFISIRSNEKGSESKAFAHRV